MFTDVSLVKTGSEKCGFYGEFPDSNDDIHYFAIQDCANVPCRYGDGKQVGFKKILLKKKKKHSAAEIGAMTLSSRRPEGLRSANFCGDRKFGGKKLRRGQRAKFQCVAL